MVGSVVRGVKAADGMGINGERGTKRIVSRLSSPAEMAWLVADNSRRPLDVQMDRARQGEMQHAPRRNGFASDEPDGGFADPEISTHADENRIRRVRAEITGDLIDKGPYPWRIVAPEVLRSTPPSGHAGLTDAHNDHDYRRHNLAHGKAATGVRNDRAERIPACHTGTFPPAQPGLVPLS